MNVLPKGNYLVSHVNGILYYYFIKTQASNFIVFNYCLVVCLHALALNKLHRSSSRKWNSSLSACPDQSMYQLSYETRRFVTGINSCVSLCPGALQVNQISPISLRPRRGHNKKGVTGQACLCKINPIIFFCDGEIWNTGNGGVGRRLQSEDPCVASLESVVGLPDMTPVQVILSYLGMMRNL